MGVRGLCRLISRHETRVSTRLDLSGSDPYGNRGLVFDGGSLLYHLEFLVRSLNPVTLHAVTGGCLPEFAQVARDYMSQFVLAQIPVWVVFDGIQIISKQKTRILRRRNVASSLTSAELALSKYCSNVNRKTTQISEINVHKFRCSDLSEAVLKEVLREMNIPIFVALYEADNECVRVCNEVRALGVVGEDSDYFVFNQNGGYVPLSSIIFDEGSVYGRLYRIRAITNVLGIPVSFLPYCACLNGNDSVLPGLEKLHLTLHRRCSSVSVLDQILAAAKAFHCRRPDATALAFLEHFIQTSISDSATANRLFKAIESDAIRKYDVGTAPVLNSTLLQLHCSGRLSSTIALDIYLNRVIGVQFGVGYCFPEDIKFVSDALAGLRQRLCCLVMSDLQSEWSISEDGLGIEFDHTVIAEGPVKSGPGMSVIDKCHSCDFSQKRKEELLRFILFGKDERNMWRNDSVFRNAIRYLMISCSDTDAVAAALFKMHQALENGSDQKPNPSSPPILHFHALKLCAVFRHTLLLADAANALLGWPLDRPKLEHCFDGATLHHQLSSFLS